MSGPKFHNRRILGLSAHIHCSNFDPTKNCPVDPGKTRHKPHAASPKGPKGIMPSSWLPSGSSSPNKAWAHAAMDSPQATTVWFMGITVNYKGIVMDYTGLIWIRPDYTRFLVLWMIISIHWPAMLPKNCCFRHCSHLPEQALPCRQPILTGGASGACSRKARKAKSFCLVMEGNQSNTILIAFQQTIYIHMMCWSFPRISEHQKMCTGTQYKYVNRFILYLMVSGYSSCCSLIVPNRPVL